MNSFQESSLLAATDHHRQIGSSQKPIHFFLNNHQYIHFKKKKIYIKKYQRRPGS